MFKVKDIILNFQEQVDRRPMNYGRDDLGDRAKGFIWIEPLKDFIKVCEKHVDEFILQCQIDDQTLPEPDIEFLFNLDYPSTQELLNKYPNYFCELLFDFQDLLINVPYIDIPYFEKKKTLSLSWICN